MKKAFTLLELLLVIAIVASLSGLIINALNPAERLQEANDVKAVINAADVYKSLQSYVVENSGAFPAGINSLSKGYYDICNPNGSLANCANLNELIPNYISSLPVDPVNSSDDILGYKLYFNPNTNEFQVYSYDEYIDVTSVVPITSGLVIWLDASDEATLFQDNLGMTPASTDSETIGMWKDKSGNSNDLTQSTSTARPLYKTGILNNKPVLRFDGTSDEIRKTGTLIPGLNPRTYIAVTRANANTIVLSDGLWNWGLAVLAQSNTSMRYGTQLGSTSGSFVSSSSYKIIGYVWDTSAVNIGDIKLYDNGNNIANGANTTALSSVGNGTFLVGRSHNGSGPQWFNGDIAEILAYNRGLSSEEITIVTEYLAEKWGISL